jgi:hypothetical protein
LATIVASASLGARYCKEIAPNQTKGTGVGVAVNIDDTCVGVAPGTGELSAIVGTGIVAFVGAFSFGLQDIRKMTRSKKKDVVTFKKTPIF